MRRSPKQTPRESTLLDLPRTHHPRVSPPPRNVRFQKSGPQCWVQMIPRSPGPLHSRENARALVAYLGKVLSSEADSGEIRSKEHVGREWLLSKVLCLNPIGKT